MFNLNPSIMGLFLLLVSLSLGHAADRLPVEIIAHRGASYDAPENTLAAFKLGFEQQADFGELDTWVSKDGHAVVIHDSDTKRVTGLDLKVAMQTLQELRKQFVKSGKPSTYNQERIPTLEEALATVPAEKGMFVEIKCGPEGVPEILRTLATSQLKPNQTPVISFNARVVELVKRERPDLPAYWIVAIKDKPSERTNMQALIAKALEIKADGLDVSDNPLVTQSFVHDVKVAGLRCYVWTVDKPESAQRYIELGVHGITTNRPGYLRELLQQR